MAPSWHVITPCMMACIKALHLGIKSIAARSILNTGKIHAQRSEQSAWTLFGKFCVRMGAMQHAWCGQAGTSCRQW